MTLLKFVALVNIFFASSLFAKNWNCTEDLTLPYARQTCYTLDISWDADSKVCQFQIYKSPFNRFEKTCPKLNRELWIKSVECKKAVEATYLKFRSKTFQEDGEVHSFSSVEIIPEPFKSEDVEINSSFNYMEIYDYLGDNFNVDLKCVSY